MAAIYRYAMDRIGVGEGKLGSDRWFVPGIMNCGLPVYYREMGGYRGAVLWLFSGFFFPFFFFYDGIAGGGGGISSSKRFSEIDHFVLLDSIERIRMTTLFVYLYFCLLFYYFFSISMYRIIWFDFRFSLLCIFNGFDENQTDICINLYLMILVERNIGGYLAWKRVGSLKARVGIFALLVVSAHVVWFSFAAKVKLDSYY